MVCRYGVGESAAGIASERIIPILFDEELEGEGDGRFVFRTIACLLFALHSFRHARTQES